jgi:hypothetical protein
MMKKIYLTGLFLVIMFVSNMGQTNKVVPAGSGTEADPYQISSLANLSWLMQNSSKWNKHYIQTANINASETATWDDADDNNDGDLFNDANDLTSEGSNNGWLPIGNETDFFSGVYNGNGYKINGITINRPSAKYIGVFGSIRTDFGLCQVKNLGVTDVNIIGGGYTGGFTGGSNAAYILNCYSEGIVVSTSNIGYVGGFIGYNYNGAITEKCYAKVNVTFNGTEDGDAHIGGFVGRNRNPNSTINECFCTGNVTTTGNIRRVGGFAGQQAFGKITNCYSTGKVNYKGARTDPQAGGFCGRSYSDTLMNCYSTGKFVAENLSDAHIRGFLGSNNDNNFYANNFLDTVASGCNGKKIAVAVIGKTTTEMQTESTFINWDFNNVWMIVGTDYPVLQALYNIDDTDAPTPNPMTFDSLPIAIGYNKITMTATTATDRSGVQYYFECLTPGGHSSNWQDSPIYVDSNLIGGTEYFYKVKARDNSKNKNETDFSEAASATTDKAPALLYIEKNGICAMEAEHAIVSANGDVTNSGDPMKWYADTVQAGYAGSGYMTTVDGVAPNATWNNGTELSWEVEIKNAGEYFLAVRRIALTLGDDSGFYGVDGNPKYAGDRAFEGAAITFAWVRGNSSLGTLTAGKHKIQIRRREAGFIVDRVMIAKNENDLPADGSNEIGPAESLPGMEIPAPNFIVAPHAISETKIEMTADNPTGKIVKFFFECLSDANHNSGWISSPTYLDTSLIPGTEYRYRVKGVDKNKYETDYSAEATAKTLGPEPAVFNEVNGICVMEAEKAIVSQNNDSTWFTQPKVPLMWEKDSTVTGFAGSGYMTTENNVALNADWNNGTELTWIVNITTNGKYYIAIRRNNNNDSNSETAKPGVDGVEKAYSAFWGSVNEFTWVHGPSLDSLDAGIHKIQIRRREDGLMIDRVMIATNSDAFPADGSNEVGPAESPVTSINRSDRNYDIPNNYVLRQNYPNPFNPTTVIEFTLPKQEDVKLSVYNTLGEKVADLVNGRMSAGYHSVNFNATNIASGIYIYRITAGNFVALKKMMLIK